MTTDYKRSLVPSTVLEILNKAFRLYRDHFRVYATVMVMVVLPLTAIGVLVDRMVPVPAVGGNAAVEYSLIISAFTLVNLLVQVVFINGPITYIASEQNLGRMTTMGEAFNAIRGRLLSLGSAMMIFYTILFALVVVSSFLLVCGVGLVGLALVVYLSIAVNAFIAPIVVLEKQPPIASILRSLLLAKTRFWSVFGLFVIVAVISLGVSGVLGTVLEGSGLSASLYGAFIVLIIEVAVAALTGPIMPIAMTLMYYDTRIRVEQLDQQIPSVAKTNFRPGDAPATPLKLAIDRRDITNLAVLTVGLILFSVLLTLLFPDLLGLAAF